MREDYEKILDNKESMYNDPLVKLANEKGKSKKKLRGE